jgi:HEAT repeat protein
VRTALAAAAIAVTAVTAAAQAPIVNARIERRTPTQSLAREVDAIAQRAAAGWIGYRVPIVTRRDAGPRRSPTCCGRCRLEAATDLIVLARVESRAIVELRSEPVDCDIDAGGMPLVWLDPVSPDDSVAWLSTLIEQRSSRPAGVAAAALPALALHAAPFASTALVAIARGATASRARGQALFWLAQRASSEALPAITAALDRDPDLQVKKQAVFALSQLPKDDGLPRLMEVARTHRDVEVRRQAMFWLGQSNDPRAIDFFAQILLK